MPNNNGQHDPVFRGAVPLGGQGEPTATVVSCIWHKFEEYVPHPPDAPKCWEQDGQWVLNMGGLLSWLTVTLTQLLPVMNNIAQHTSEVGVQVEALMAQGEEEGG